MAFCFSRSKRSATISIQAGCPFAVVLLLCWLPTLSFAGSQRDAVSSQEITTSPTTQAPPSQLTNIAAKDTSAPLLWFDATGPKHHTLSLQALAADLGLQAPPMRPKAAAQQGAELAAIDAAYSRFFVELAGQLALGKGTSLSLSVEDLNGLARQGLLATLVEDLLPPLPAIARLRNAIQKYRQLSRDPWPSLTEEDYRVGQRRPQIAALRGILTRLGDLPLKAADSYRDAIFDPSLQLGLKRFQARHGLEQSGRLDPATLDAINTPPQQRLAQLQTNLWRALALPSDPSTALVWINLPEFTLHALDRGREVLSMRVIVGKSATPTPLLSTSLTHVTVNPSWTPPTSIIYQELLPQHRRDPDILPRQGFELLGSNNQQSPPPLALLSPEQLSPLLRQYRLVQAPGAANALGRLRFSIQNQDAIYLHDTPAKSLFTRANRALSHGCIRLEDPEALLRFLLSRQPDLDSGPINRALKQSATSRFVLDQPVNVVLAYQTAWVAEDGQLQLRPDIYQLDHRATGLAQLPPGHAPASKELSP